MPSSKASPQVVDAVAFLGRHVEQVVGYLVDTSGRARRRMPGRTPRGMFGRPGHGPVRCPTLRPSKVGRIAVNLTKDIPRDRVLLERLEKNFGWARRTAPPFNRS